PWPSPEDPARLAGTNLYPSFTIYRGWDTDSGTITNADGTTLDQDHTFNNRGNIEWAEDVTYLDHLENGTTHEATRTWVLAAGKYTVNLGGNSPATLAEGRQGYRATFSTGALTRLTNGFATIDFDQAAWDALALVVGPAPVQTLTGFFPQAEANALTLAELTTNAAPQVSYLGQVYRLNGSEVVNATGRTSQPTTFAYDPASPTNHVGSVGLGGVARFAVLGGAGGTLLYGDYTLQFDAARIPLGGSGWYLKGNIPPAGAVFDLLNVGLVAEANAFRLTGDLAISFEVANFLYGTPTDTLKDVGNFVFTASAGAKVPPAIRGLSLVGGNLTITVSSGTPGATCRLVSSTDLSSPASAWDTAGQGTFDSEGNCAISSPASLVEGARFFRVRQP
ncbi:MAG: hypothetical protein JNK85_24890, partial [Verrucomicrobiales bacterium]|nr:hypothetical protein [Verrucomicrobiales bacterium]